MIFLDSRKALLVNKDCTIGLAAPKKSLWVFYKKCRCRWNDFQSQRKRKLRTMMLSHLSTRHWLFQRGIIYQIDFETEDNRLLYVESSHLFIRQNAIKWIGSTFRAFSILWTRFYFAKRIETHDERRLLLKIKKRRNDAWGRVMQRTLWRSGLGWIQFSIRTVFIISNL
jgi:homogentisate 1,2-dioxygenase